MARMHHSESQLYTQFRRNRLYLMLSILSVFLSAGLIYHYHSLLAIPICASFVVLGTWLNRRHNILKSGVQGEEKAKNLTRYLPQEYHVFNNIPLSYQGQKGEIDLLVVGKNGIFAIEIKNLKGTIHGLESAPQWHQTKISKKGNAYQQSVINPIKQVKREVYLLSHSLDNSGWIQGMVWFTHNEVSLRVKSKSVPVFSSGEALANYITRYKNSQTVKPEALNDVINQLKKLTA
ncbi:MAG: nuclease-related domain-containing protein [Bacillota bacterium]|nr:nuclease-related domain-containing protein [Bacillota bacterium]